MFVEFSLDIKRQIPNTFLMSYTNGELQGYLVTQQAVDEGGYESANAIFQSPESGNLLVQKTLELLKSPFWSVARRITRCGHFKYLYGRGVWCHVNEQISHL